MLTHLAGLLVDMLSRSLGMSKHKSKEKTHTVHCICAIKNITHDFVSKNFKFI